MHRASSLGLPPIAIQQCLSTPGATIGRKFLTFARRTSTTHCSVSRRTSQGEHLDTESFQLGGVARPVVFPSRGENTLRSSPQPEKHLAEKFAPGEESKKQVCEENVTGTNLSNQDMIDSLAKEIVEGGEGPKNIHPSSLFVQDAPFLSGRPWAQRPVKPLGVTSENHSGLSTGRTMPSIGGSDAVVKDMLYVLATTASAEEGWKAYGVLSRVQQQRNSSGGGVDTIPVIPFAHLHRLARVIARNVPKTRLQFLHLLSVLATIQNYGGTIHLHEWNALIDHAGKGYRKIRPENFNNALSIYYDMIYNRPPGSGLSSVNFDDDLSSLQEDDPFGPYPPPTPAAEPDIYTYTTLIDIAARTGHPSLVHRATTLLKHAELSPNRITHIALLKYFTTNGQLSGVRSTLARMREQNLDIGVDGLNACMWAYGHGSRVDIVLMIYRALRHNMVPEEYAGEDDITSVQECLRGEGILVPPDLRPNEITFTTMIQVIAYRGNLLTALSVFIDMLSTPNSEQGAPIILDKNGELQRAPYLPTVHVFRALFLGFCRHGVNSNSDSRQENPPDLDVTGPEWDLENLQSIFEKFLNLSPNTQISESTIFWILSSFSRTSGHDVELLRTIWLRLEDRFGRFKRGPHHRLTKWRYKLFPEYAGQEAGKGG